MLRRSINKILTLLKRLPGDLVWFIATPKDWEPDGDYKIEIDEEGYLKPKKVLYD